MVLAPYAREGTLYFHSQAKILCLANMSWLKLCLYVLLPFGQKHAGMLSDSATNSI